MVFYRVWGQNGDHKTCVFSTFWLICWLRKSMVFYKVWGKKGDHNTCFFSTFWSFVGSVNRWSSIGFGVKNATTTLVLFFDFLLICWLRKSMVFYRVWGQTCDHITCVFSTFCSFIGSVNQWSSIRFGAINVTKHLRVFEFLLFFSLVDRWSSIRFGVKNVTTKESSFRLSLIFWLSKSMIFYRVLSQTCYHTICVFRFFDYL